MVSDLDCPAPCRCNLHESFHGLPAPSHCQSSRLDVQWQPPNFQGKPNDMFCEFPSSNLYISLVSVHSYLPRDLSSTDFYYQISLCGALIQVLASFAASELTKTSCSLILATSTDHQNNSTTFGKTEQTSIQVCKLLSVCFKTVPDY
jgi:hypothetical protein